MAKHKNYKTFASTIPFLTLKLYRWDSHDVENTASNVRRLGKPRSREPSQPPSHMNTLKILQRIKRKGEISDNATPWTNLVFRAYYLQGV